MAKGLLIGLLSFFLFSCRSKSGPYFNHEKWLTGDEINRNPLKKSPKEVREEEYERLSDTTFAATGELLFSRIIRFDSSGNVTLFKTQMNEFSETEFVSNYDANGHSYHFLGKDLSVIKQPDETKSNSVRMNDGRYKVTSYKNGKLNFLTIETYSADGSMIKKERKLKDSLIYATTIYLEHGKVKKEEQHLGDSILISNLYYYSPAGFLDSAVIVSGHTIQSRTIYVNNHYGDCVFYSEYHPAGREAKGRIKYEYDSQGNWTGMMEIETDNLRTWDPYRVSLVKRTIKY